MTEKGQMRLKRHINRHMEDPPYKLISLRLVSHLMLPCSTTLLFLSQTQADHILERELISGHPLR
jgi:hypothetical protein